MQGGAGGRPPWAWRARCRGDCGVCGSRARADPEPRDDVSGRGVARHQNVDVKKTNKKNALAERTNKKGRTCTGDMGSPRCPYPSSYVRCPAPHPPCGMRATAMCMCGTVSLSHVLAAHAGAPAVRRNQQAPPRAVAPHVAARQLRRQLPPSFGLRRGDRRRHAILRDR